MSSASKPLLSVSLTSRSAILAAKRISLIPQRRSGYAYYYVISKIASHDMQETDRLKLSLDHSTGMSVRYGRCPIS